MFDNHGIESIVLQVLTSKVIGWRSFVWCMV